MSKNKAMYGKPQPMAAGYEPRFNATIWVDHPETMTDFYNRLKAGQSATPADIAMLGDFTGGLNWSEDNPDQFVPVGYTKDANGNFIKSGGSTQPPSSDAPWNYPIHMDTPMWGEVRRTGVDGYPALNTRVVTSIPIRIPQQNFSVPLLDLSVSEFGTPACAKQVTLSRVAGDFISYLSFGQGNTASAKVNVGVDAQPGETLYFNVRFWSADLNAPGTDDATAGVSISGAWPR